jgi:hypothetical protein
MSLLDIFLYVQYKINIILTLLLFIFPLFLQVYAIHTYVQYYTIFYTFFALILLFPGVPLISLCSTCQREKV